MVEVSLLPNDPVLATLKMLPVADDPAHALVACERQEGMEMIGHQQKQRDVPTLFSLVEPSGF